MDFLLHFLPSQALEESGHWSVGMQTAAYVAPPGPLSLIAGFDIDRTEGTLTEFQSIPTVFSFTQGLHYDYKVNALTLSPFVSADIQVASRLTINAAARLDYARYRYENRTDSGEVGRFLRPADRLDEFTTISPKLSASYRVNDAAAIYAGYSRGARAPQTTDLYRLQINQTTDSAQPETIDSYEIGFKFGDERISLTAAAFFMEKENFFFRDGRRL